MPGDDTVPAGGPGAGLAVVPVASGWHYVSTAP
jgi:hypothetical protein